MYFWSIKALKDKIRGGNFSDKDAIVYIVITIALYSIWFELVSFFPLIEEYNIWDSVDSFLSILVPIWGTIYAYKKNGGADGKDFANKYFSIGFVMSIRFLVYFIGVLIVMMFYWNYAYGGVEEIPTTVIDTVVFFIWYAAIYYQIGKHIEEVNQ